MQGEAQAIMRVGPAPVGSTALNRNFDITPAVDGSSEWQVPGTGPGIEGCWITLTNYSSAVIRFCTGTSTAGTNVTIANAAATDNALPAGATQDFWMNVGIDRVRFIGAATPGASAYRSSI